MRTRSVPPARWRGPRVDVRDAPRLGTEAIADHDRGDTDWVPWVGATALVLVLAVAAGELHLAARRRAAW